MVPDETRSESIGGDPYRSSSGGSGDWTSGPSTGGRMGGEVTGTSGDDARPPAEALFSPTAFGTAGGTVDAGGEGARVGSGTAGVDQPSGMSGWGDQASGVTAEAGAQGATATPAGGSQGGGPLGAERWEFGGSGGASIAIPGTEAEGGSKG